MEQTTVFYRIFNADLSPTIEPSIEQKKEYVAFLNHYASIPGYPVTPDIQLLSDTSLRFCYYKTLLHKTVKEIEAELHHRVFVYGQTETEMRNVVIKFQRYINQNLQMIRTSFIPEEEHEHILKISDRKDKIDVYKLVYGCLADLHDYLEKAFSHYLDKHIIVPCKKRSRFIEEQSSNAKLALNAIKNYKHHSELKELLSSTIERFLNDGFKAFTYAQMDYCAKLNKTLNQYFNHSALKKEEDFVLLMVQINFNRNGVLQYIIAYINTRLQEKESCCDKLEIVSYCIKSINRIQYPHNFAYNEKLLSLKELLIDWLEHKMRMISLKDIEIKDPIRMLPNEPQLKGPKYKVNLSVPESALLIRVLKNSHIVDAPKEKLFNFFSQYFYTNHASTVSPDRLEKKYYEPSEKNLRTLKEALQRCIYNLDEIGEKLRR